MTLFGVFSGKDTHFVYPNGDEVSNVDIVYICKDYHGTLRPQAGEVEELRFFEPDQIPEKLFVPIANPLKKYINTKR